MVLAPVEPDPPAPLSLLLGPDATQLLTAAVNAYGGRLRGFRVAGVGVQPSGATVVRYDADVERADDTRSREILVATTGGRIPRDVAVLSGQGAQVGVWRWPQDPALPALATATDPHRLAAVLRAAGLTRTALPEVRVRGYRPGRRAVLEIDGGGPRLYAKVVRPAAVGGLRARHELLAPHLPVPRVLTATPDGLLVLPELPGTPLRTALAADGSLPDSAALETVLDTLPDALLALPGRHGHLQRVRHFAGVLALTAVTTAADRARLDALETVLTDVDPGAYPVVPVHGDFYEGQLLVGSDGAVTGLLDIDTVGPGQRIDEWATMLAHLSVLALHRTWPGPVDRYGAALLSAAETRYPRARLRSRVAAAVLGLATGPFRVQQDRWPDHTRARLTLAEQWLAG